MAYYALPLQRIRYGNPGEYDENDYDKDGVYAYNGGRPECY